MERNLYHVQDNDTPMWVIANSMASAIVLWKLHILETCSDDYSKVEEVEEPNGVNLLCNNNELIIPDPVINLETN